MDQPDVAISSAMPRVGRLALPALMVANICLAFGPWLVRLGQSDGGVGPLASGFWRVALAAPVLLLLTRAVRQPIGRMARSAWIGLGVAGLFFAADLASWHVGILQTKLANATLLGNAASFFYPACAMLIARTWPQPRQAFAILLALGGVGLLLGTSYDVSPRNLVGDLLCIMAGLFYTGYLMAIARARVGLSPLPTIALATLAAVLPLWLAATALREPIMPVDWTPLILLALGSQVIGQGLMVYAVGHLPPLILGLGLLTQPVMAAAIGWLAFGERLGMLDLIGAVLIAVALVLVRRSEPST